MAEAIDEEIIMPDLLTAGARFNFGKVDAAGTEGFERAEERAGLVVQGKDKAGFVAPGTEGRRDVGAEDEEARDVVGAILDAGGDDGDAVEFGGEAAGHGGGTGGFARAANGLGGAVEGGGGGGGQVAAQPFTALAEGLVAGENGFDFLERLVGNEAVLNGEEDLRDDFQFGLDEHVERVEDGTFGGVFDGDDAVVGLAAFDGGEDIGDGGAGLKVEAGAEIFEGGLVGEGRFGAEVGDAEFLLERKGGGDDFAVNGLEGGGGERAGVGGEKAFEDGFLAAGDIGVRALLLLGAADLAGEAHARVETLDDFEVHRVDLLAQGVEVHGGKRRIKK